MVCGPEMNPTGRAGHSLFQKAFTEKNFAPPEHQSWKAYKLLLKPQLVTSVWQYGWRCALMKVFATFGVEITMNDPAPKPATSPSRKRYPLLEKTQ